MSETVVVSAASALKVEGQFRDVKEMEEAIGVAVRMAALGLYEEAWRAFQEGWLEQHREQFIAIRWRRRRLLTPFGLTEVPTRVVRERGVARGGYHSLGKLLRRGLATRELSPGMERAAVEAAAQENYRPAARSLGRWLRVRVSHWVVWSCVQYYGQKLREHQERGWWPDRPLAERPAIVISEVDTAILRRQRWGQQRKRLPSFFGMQLGLHYTGRERMGALRRKDVRLTDKRVLMSTEPVGIFGPWLRQQRNRHYGSAGYLSVLLSDGDEGLEWMRERVFPDAIWVLDRWHVARRVREYVAQDQEQFNRIMKPVYASDSEAILEAIRSSDDGLQRRRPKAFKELFGYILGNREGIDNWRQIPARFRHQVGRHPAAVRSGTGAVEKHVELQVNRRFKWQGRSWNPRRADNLAQLAWLQRQPQDWERWWNQVCLSTVRVNPSWAT